MSTTVVLKLLFKDHTRKIYVTSRGEIAEKAKALEIGIRPDECNFQYFDAETESFLDLTNDTELRAKMEIRVVPKASECDQFHL